MVDFNKRIKKRANTQVLDPRKIYDSLDRASDKGPLRPVQDELLRHWHDSRRSDRDLIVKLHTGQGKTLIGLLMLQSRLNESLGPALYACPSRFLVEQTCAQARQFGIPVVRADDHLPGEFLASQAILVTTAQKVFNGRTRFGLGPKSESVTSFLMDDCHACIDIIRQATSISLDFTSDPYQDLLGLFRPDLRDQGAGTLSDIEAGDFDALHIVPYWAWRDHADEALDILSTYKAHDEIRFAWPLLRDMIEDCNCIFSGGHLEIVPVVPPLDLFGSFSEAKHRVFMSATVTDDSFLIKGLGLSPETIKNPLGISNERWCGEKMLLLPSLIHPELTRERVISTFAQPRKKRTFGVVGLAPSFSRAKAWEEAGAQVAQRDTIGQLVEALKDANCETPVCIVNRYDGVDLPDDACRILVLDSKPMGASLMDRYLESCRPTSDVVAQRVARAIEQGLGRSVRGEKDFCAIILAGADLTRAVRMLNVRKYYSEQTQLQLEIGLEIAEFAKQDMDEGIPPLEAMRSLVSKLLNRDLGWKRFYIERMTNLKPTPPSSRTLDTFTRELEAEKKHLAKRHDEAAHTIQAMLDEEDFDDAERGWYQQEMARYTYSSRKAESKKLQVAAHSLNRYLLKPRDGITVKKLTAIPKRRIEAIIEWARESADHQQLMVNIDALLTDLRFGGNAERFESALNSLGQALGYSTERPDKEWGEGPDNLWCLDENNYLLVECKNRVDPKRTEISKAETGQMNNSYAWFEKNYPGARAHSRMVIPCRALGKGAGFNGDVRIITRATLKNLRLNIRKFFGEFKATDLNQLHAPDVNQWLDAHSLRTEHMLSQYCKSHQ